MKFFVALLLVAVTLGAVSAGYIGGDGWSPDYNSVGYVPSYSGWNNGWSGGLSGSGGWNRDYNGGWNNDWSGSW